MKSILVFCGSSSGKNPIYAEVSVKLGHLLAESEITLIYGAGNVGLMGILADACLDKGGKVIGTIPQFLKDLEVAHESITELHVVETMHERKSIMAEMAEGVIILPGGIGTMDEFFEMFTWQQLGLHSYPIGILNVNGFYDHILNHIKHMVSEGFLKQFHHDRIIVDEDPTSLIEKMKAQIIGTEGKWID